MPKMKSVRGASKRFKVKKSGKVKRGTAFRSHILTKVDGKHHRKWELPNMSLKLMQKILKRLIAYFRVISPNILGKSEILRP